MADRRFVCIWLRYLLTDEYALRHEDARGKACVVAVPDHGRKLISAVNALAAAEGIRVGQVLADARAIVHGLHAVDAVPGAEQPLLEKLADWAFRYSPIVGIHPPDVLVLDASGCAHLWGSESNYLQDMLRRLLVLGYSVRLGMADTIGAAWALAHAVHLSGPVQIAGPGEHPRILASMPPALLRIDHAAAERLQKLGLRRVGDFISMPRTALRRRFGPAFLLQLDYALGLEQEPLLPVHPLVEYQERLPCPEPISTAVGIQIALERLLDLMCKRLSREGKGVRSSVFRCLRLDGVWLQISIGTTRPSVHEQHLFKLFELRIDTLEPGLGIEMFVLEVPLAEDLQINQERLWQTDRGLDDSGLAELVDRLGGKLGAGRITRYVPDEHYWPERSHRPVISFAEQAAAPWKTDRPRPVRMLDKPDPIEVTAPIPDYPPMLFRHKGRLHQVRKADGPERIEQEWWIQQGEHRDYYYVEDQDGLRYWIFRLGHYEAEKNFQWFLHGFFA